MFELAPPHNAVKAADARLMGVERALAMRNHLDAQIRLQLVQLWLDDTAPEHQKWFADELALAVNESPGTAERWLHDAYAFSRFPQVVARCGLPLSEGGWSVRHADALIDAITGIDLPDELQSRVVDLVSRHADAKTPHQVRKAAQAAVLVLDPEAAARRYAKTKRDRHVGTFSNAAGSHFYAAGTHSQIAAVMNSLDALAGPQQPGDARTLDQRRFDAFMDLICGRVQPGQWQAVIVVALSTLEGGSEAAEIPGFGMVSAEEARDLLASAELRRAVVDEHGHLVSLDTHVARPDLPAEENDPVVGLSLDPEPDRYDSTPEEPEPSPADRAWAARDAMDDQADHADLADRADTGADDSELERGLRALLGTSRVQVSTTGHLVVELDLDHPHGGPSDGGSGGDPGDGPHDPSPPDPERPEAEPEPEPPTLADVLWDDATLDRYHRDPAQPRPRHRRDRDLPVHPVDLEPLLPDRLRQRTGPPPRTSSWTLAALQAAHRRVVTAAVDRRPLDSTAYALPPRLERFIKLRDLTCTFPGCPRLARDCQNDHVLRWPQGRSTAANTRSECIHHHQAKHHSFTVEPLPHGGLRWTTRLGRVYDRNARPLLRGW